MGLLGGINPPAIRAGRLLEMHIDSEDVSFSGSFTNFVLSNGFEPDPFSVNYDRGSSKMINHWTGRIWSQPGQSLKPLTDNLRQLSRQIIAAAKQSGLRLYVETELIIGDMFGWQLPEPGCTLAECLDKFNFKPTNKFGGAKSDIHVEFSRGIAGEASGWVGQAFMKNCFYPVTGVDQKDQEPYIVYTLQTEEYYQGLDLYRALIKSIDIPGFRQITLEQKLGMACSVDDLKMPEMIAVSAK